MDLQEVMEQQTFAVLGDTLNVEKYAYKIKQGLKKKVISFIQWEENYPLSMKLRVKLTLSICVSIRLKLSSF